MWLSLVLAAGCLSSTTGPGIGPGVPVLFIGNSLTYTNDLPGIVQALADSAGSGALAVDTWAAPNAALIDHWNGGARAKVQSRDWGFVVLQQGPSSVEVNRDTLRLATKLFAPDITKGGGKPVLFSAWPTNDRRQDYPRAIESYRLAAADVGGLFAPVASAWLATWTRDVTIGLYDADGLHPSLHGSYLSALVIYARISGRNPIGLPSTLRLRSGLVITISPATARILQEAAWEAISNAG